LLFTILAVFFFLGKVLLHTVHVFFDFKEQRSEDLRIVLAWLKRIANLSDIKL